MGAGASADYYEDGYAYKRRYYDGARGRPRSRYDSRPTSRYSRPDSRYNSRPASRYSSRPTSRYKDRDRYYVHDYNRRSARSSSRAQLPPETRRTPLPPGKKIFTAKELEDADIFVDKGKSVRFANDTPVALPQTPGPTFAPSVPTLPQIMPTTSYPGIIPSSGYPLMASQYGSLAGPTTLPVSYGAQRFAQPPAAHASYHGYPYYANQFGRPNYGQFRSWDTSGAYSMPSLPRIKPSIESFSKFGVPATGPVKMFNGDPIANGRALVTKRPY